MKGYSQKYPFWVAFTSFAQSSLANEPFKEGENGQDPSMENPQGGRAEQKGKKTPLDLKI